MLRRFAFFVVLLALLGVPTPVVPPTARGADPDTITVHIRVVDADKHKGIEGVRVFLTVENGTAAYSTDTEGVREFKVPVGSNFMVTLWYPGAGFFQTYRMYADKEPPPPNFKVTLDLDPPARLESTTKVERLSAIQNTACMALFAGADHTSKEILARLNSRELLTEVRELSSSVPNDGKWSRILTSAGRATEDALEQVRDMH